MSRSDKDELIFLDLMPNPYAGIDVTMVVVPEREAKVRGIFETINFHIDPQLSCPG